MPYSARDGHHHVLYRLKKKLEPRMLPTPVAPFSLYAYQQGIVDWVTRLESGPAQPMCTHETRGGLVALHTGLGKTLCAAAIVAGSLHAQRTAGSPTLYVCPRQLLLTVRDDIRKFYGAALTLYVDHREESRARSSIHGYDIVITSYDTVAARVAAHGEFRGTDWYRIIVDESHEIRDQRSRRFRSMMVLQSRRRLCMSATPIYRRPSDILAQLQFCGVRFPPGRTRWYRPATLEASGLSSLIRLVPAEHAQSSYPAPAVTERTHWFGLTPAERRVHERCVQRATSDKAAVAAYLARPAPPGATAWESDRTAAGLLSSCFDCMASILGSIPIPAKAIVFSASDDVARLARDSMCHRDGSYRGRSMVLDASVRSLYQRADIVTRFRTVSACTTLFTTFSSGGCGLNLPEADHVVFVQEPACASSGIQAIGRVVRIGRCLPVVVHYMRLDHGLSSPLPVVDGPVPRRKSAVHGDTSHVHGLAGTPRHRIPGARIENEGSSDCSGDVPQGMTR
jgi:hypothetical protein